MAADQSLSRRAVEPVVGYSAGPHDLVATYLQRFDRAQTRRAYLNDLNQFFGSDFVPLDLARSVSFIGINQHVEMLEQAGARPATIKRRLAALRGFFDFLLALELVPRNPVNRQLVRRTTASRAANNPIVFLSSAQAQLLVDATRDNGKAAIRDRALILVMLHCVLRRSEAAGMDRSHIRPVGRHWVLDLPRTKGGADQYVKMPPQVVEEIDAMCEFYGISDGPLWRSLSNHSSGSRLTPHSIYRIVKNTAERAGLTGDIGAHTLRHTGCTLAIEAGAAVQQVQAHARHKSIDTTMMYVHQRDRLQNSAADFIHIRSTDPE